MNDHEAVAAIAAGDAAGLVDVYDRYAPALYGYCRMLLRDPQDAADAIQDTFVITAARVRALRDPGRLHAWLYAVARNECHRKLQSRETPAEIDDADAMLAADAGMPPQQAELRELVHAAIAELNPPDQEVIELSLRHDLEGGELAAVLGISRHHAQAAVSRARAQLEKNLGALLVARTGRRDCAGLDAILASWDGQLTAVQRTRVNRHIENCGSCGERKRRALRPAMMYGFAPLALPPARLRHQVLALCSDDSPDAMEFKGDVAREAGRFDPDGFPRLLVRAGRRRLSEPGSALVAAASVAAAAVVIIVMIALRGSPPLRTLDDNRTSGGPGSAAATSVVVVPTPSLMTSTAPVTALPTSAADLAPTGSSTAASPTSTPKKSSPAPSKSGSPSPSPIPSPTPSPSLPSTSPTGVPTFSPTTTAPSQSPTAPPTSPTTVPPT